MAQATLMQYDDDFDEEDFYERKQGEKKYAVKLADKGKGKNKTPSKNKEEEKQAMIVSEDISEITKKTESDNFNPQDEFDLDDDEDTIDFMDKFIEGQDVELVKDHSSSF